MPRQTTTGRSDEIEGKGAKGGMGASVDNKPTRPPETMSHSPPCLRIQETSPPNQFRARLRSAHISSPARRHSVRLDTPFHPGLNTHMLQAPGPPWPFITPPFIAPPLPLVANLRHVEAPVQRSGAQVEQEQKLQKRKQVRQANSVGLPGPASGEYGRCAAVGWGWNGDRPVLPAWHTWDWSPPFDGAGSGTWSDRILQ